ncbi:MAG: hypothetical protein MJK04_31450 [Psychrosphaera sp.]|nr:hypothetical protein [Psychrosphaera sp.]
MFDMNADGFQTRMQWVKQNGNEAFLVRDLNNNGIIDNGAELFGNGTQIMPIDMSTVLAADGFTALAQYDQPAAGGNDDGYISADDMIWSELQLWLDVNADGQTTTDEMLSLADVGITHLDITPKLNRRRDRAGNLIPLWSWATDNETNAKYKMVNVFFKAY